MNIPGQFYQNKPFPDERTDERDNGTA